MKDSAVLERLRQLAIPPAWVEVWGSADAEASVQATGVDQRGRTQYRYSPRPNIWPATTSSLV